MGRYFQPSDTDLWFTIGTERAQRGHREGTERAQRGHREGTERAQRGHKEGAERAQGGRRVYIRRLR
jgi:predicted transposase YdaD